jgi:hypothetical protein
VPDEPDYIVLRPGPGMTGGQWDGTWIDRSQVTGTLRLTHGAPLASATARARPTGRFEAREDGAVAEVWEVTRD